MNMQHIRNKSRVQNNRHKEWKRKISRTKYRINRRACLKAERDAHQYWADHYEENQKLMNEMISKHLKEQEEKNVMEVVQRRED